MTVLRVEALTKTFQVHAFNQQVPGCQQVTFNVLKGEFVGITGPSGSGKSTVMKLIHRTYEADAGRAWYVTQQGETVDLASCDDRTVVALRRQEIAYVSQFLQVIPRTTARELVERSMLDRQVAPEDASREAAAVLKRFGLPEPLWDMFPRTFSGGEKLRLNVARAMVAKPRLLLLDEPTASLDAVSKAQVRELLLELKASGTSMLGIFHDLEFMDGVCDRVLHMRDGSLTAE